MVSHPPFPLSLGQKQWQLVALKGIQDSFGQRKPCLSFLIHKTMTIIPILLTLHRCCCVDQIIMDVKVLSKLLIAGHMLEIVVILYPPRQKLGLCLTLFPGQQVVQQLTV